MGWVVFVLVMIGLGVAVWYFGFTEAGKKAAENMAAKAEQEREAKQDAERARGQRQISHDRKHVKASISNVGDRSSGVLACPKCGGTQFKAKRSRGSKLLTVPTVGMGSLLVPKRRVKCVTCGTEYMRG